MMTKNQRIRKALRADAMIAHIVSRSVRDSASMWRSDAAGIAERAISGRKYKAAVAAMVARQRKALADTMTLTWLRGYATAVSNARSHTSESLSLQLSYDTEIRQISGGLPLTEAELAAARTAMAAEAKRVLTMAGTALEAAVRKTVRGAVEDGLLKRDAIRRIKETVVGANTAEPYRLEAIYRTSANMSYSAGRWKANENPAVSSVLWGYEFHTVGDSRVRSEHAPFDNARYPKDHTFWDTHMPPLGWNCRCTTIEIYLDEPGNRIVPPKPGGKVAEGFKFNPGKVL